MSFYHSGALWFLIHRFYIYLLNIYYALGIELGISVQCPTFLVDTQGTGFLWSQAGPRCCWNIVSTLKIGSSFRVGSVKSGLPWGKRGRKWTIIRYLSRVLLVWAVMTGMYGSHKSGYLFCDALKVEYLFWNQSSEAQYLWFSFSTCQQASPKHTGIWIHVTDVGRPSISTCLRLSHPGQPLTPGHWSHWSS